MFFGSQIRQCNIFLLRREVFLGFFMGSKRKKISDPTEYVILR